MLGGLYGDLPPPSTADEEGSSSSSVWSSSAKMAPPTLRKQSTILQPQAVLKIQRSHFKAKSSLTPQEKELGASTLLSLSEFGSKAPSFQPPLVGVTSTVLEEYDPARPTDYEEYRREKKRKNAEEEMKRELERRRQEEEERERERKQREQAAAESKENGYQSRSSALSISDEEAWKRRAAMSKGVTPRSPSPPSSVDGFSIGKSTTAGLGIGAGGHMTAAQRMMAKMGWKEGQGLGKQEQGITTPLMAKKTDRRAGVIVHASEPKSEKKVKSANLNGPPTRVVLLQNMVGPGEVDAELEDEITSECTKYGTVTRVVIFEITEENFPAEEAVRIFVQFERPEEATKALIDLGGRFFGGRVVHASFYDEETFGMNELAPVLVKELVTNENINARTTWGGN